MDNSIINENANNKYLLFDRKVMRFFINEVFQFLAYVNISTNECRYYEQNINSDNAVIQDYDYFILKTAAAITDEKQQADFINTFQRKNLLTSIKNGKKQQSLKYKMLLDEQNEYWVESKIVLIDCENNEYTAAFFTKNIHTEMSQLEHMSLLMKKERIYKNAINANASGYFEVNLSKDIIISKIYDFKRSKTLSAEVDPGLGYPVPYSKFMHWSLENVFKSNTKSYLLNTDKEYLISKFHSGARTHDVSFWSYSRTGNIHFHKQTYYMSRDERTDDIIALCVLKDETESEKKEAELRRNNEVISVLSDEYTTIFYVDIENNIVIPYRITPEFKNLFRIHNLDNKPFSEIMECYAEYVVVDDDKNNFRKTVSIDNIRKQLYYKKNFSLVYRSLSIGVSRFFEMKFAKIGYGTAFESFVVGFSNKDEQFRKEKERQGRMNQNNEIINVFASEYEFVFFIDLETETYTPYNLTGITGQIIAKYARSAPKFNDLKNMYVENWVVNEDKERIFHEADLSYIKEQLFDKKTYKTEFMAFSNNLEPHYYEMRAIKVENKSIPTSIVLGVADRNDEIRMRHQYNLELKEARIKAEKANKAKSTFLFNMSHDIRTPMNAILGFTSMAQKYIYEPEHVSECLDKVQISGNHLLSIINDVLDMARIESNKIVIEETPNNIRLNIEQFVDIMQSNANEKDISLSLQIKNLTDENIYVDALRLNRVIMNIMSNSLKYTKPGGEITVTLEQFPSDKEGYGKYDIIFSDTGIGMSKEFLETIFDAFTREKTSTVSGIQGTGLGMAITKNFIELMGGTIEIDSALGIGTTVTCHMYFRIQEQECTTDDEDRIEDNIDFSNIRLLLVEDNELNREIAKDILEEIGITVEEASDGSIAVDMITLKPAKYYDLIFMDIQMPYMDGYTATQIIRNISDKEIASVPIVAMTANAFEEDKKKAFESGMDGHLAKPLNVHEMLKIICKFCNVKDNNT